MATNDGDATAALRGRSLLELSLRQRIASGSLVPGATLPTILALAEEFTLARSTVQSALERLVGEGVLTRSGRRRVVAATAATSTPSARDPLAGQTMVVIGSSPPVPPSYQLSAGWNGMVRLALGRRLSHHGRHVVHVGDGQDGTLSLLDELHRHPPGGIAALMDDGLPVAVVDALKSLQTQGIPVVAYSASDATPGCQTFDRVITDHAAGCAALCRWMFARGRRRVLRYWTVADPTAYPGWLADRARGYAAAHAEAGITPLPPLELLPITGLDGHRRGFDAAVRLAMGWLLPYVGGPQPLIDGILCTSDGETGAITAALRALGLASDAVLVAGYDGYWADLVECQWEARPLAVTVDRRLAEVGELLADWLAAPAPTRGTAPRVTFLEPRTTDIG